MAGYELFIKPSALKELDSPDSRKTRRNLVSHIQALARKPRPPGCRKVAAGDRFRIRCGDWRVVYAVDDERRTVTVFKIGHRKDVYR